jgi:hypothetical protein
MRRYHAFVSRGGVEYTRLTGPHENEIDLVAEIRKTMNEDMTVDPLIDSLVILELGQDANPELWTLDWSHIRHP